MVIMLTNGACNFCSNRLLGPRRKMTAAIACLNRGAQDLNTNFEQVYSTTMEQLNEVITASSF
jgi:hypothetical protein